VRKAFVAELCDLAADDPRIVLLTGDLGFMVLEPFAERFGDRFFNVGVAEQNMIGLATGMAEAGLRPYAYSIATFASLRPFEFIRNGPVRHQLPVRIVAVGGGFEYGPAGPTHHALEDVALMRTQPGLCVVAPADHVQAREVVRKTSSLDGPVYLRLGKDDTTVVPGLGPRFDLGRIQRVRRGSDVAILAMGAIAAEAVKAAEVLSGHGVDAEVGIVASIAPAPVEDLEALLASVPTVVTVEEHMVTGGLGSLVAEIAAERGGARVVRLGVTSAPPPVGGSEAYLRRIHGLTAEHIAAAAVATVEVRR